MAKKFNYYNKKFILLAIKEVILVKMHVFWNELHLTDRKKSNFVLFMVRYHYLCLEIRVLCMECFLYDWCM